MKHNFLKFLLAGMALLGTSINIWALDSHFSIVGNPTGGWDKKVNLDKTYSGRDGEFYTAIYIENNQYFALHNGSSQYGPNTNNSAIKNGSGGGQGTYNSNAWKFTGTNGLVMVCAAENNDREWYPYVYVEEHDIKLKHPWDGSSWSWSDAMTNKKNGTYELTATIKGASTGYNYGDGSNEYGWIATPTCNPTTIADGSKCLIVLDAKTFKITVTRYQTITYNINGGSGASAPSAQEQLYNQSITLAAMPSGLAKTGYNFTGWNTASDGTGDHYAAGETISNLTSDLTLYAEWTEKTFTVTAAKGTGCASVNPTGAQTVGQLTGKQFTATASTGYSFDSWTSNNGGTFSTQAATTTFKPTGAATITANFTEVLTSVTISSNGNGTVSPTSASVGVATTESVSATPADGYHFASWAVTGNADIKGATTSNPVTLYGNGSGSIGTLKATFAETLYTITIESGTAASTTAGCVTTGTATAAAAAEGKKFDKWDLGTGITLVGCAVTDQTITFHASQAATVTATYTDASKYNLNVVAGTGITSVSGSKTDQTILPIESEISATAKTGYTFAQWAATGEGTVSYTSGSATSANATVSVTVGSVTLTASATPNNDTPYKVKHYKQNLENDDYTLAETEDKIGTTDASVTPDVKDYEGFTAPSTTTVTIAGDGSTVVEYQYARKSYTLTWAGLEGATTQGGTPAGSVKYGATLTAPTVEKTGYNFTGWSPSVPATMPADNSTYTAQWTEVKSTLTADVNDIGTAAGYKVTGANAIGVVSTAILTASAAGTGYTFEGWTLTNCTRTSGAEKSTTITVKGTGNGEAATATANYAEDLNTGWRINLGYDGMEKWFTNDFVKKSGASTTSVGYLELELQENYEYKFKVVKKSPETWYGNNGTMTQDNCTNWTFYEKNYEQVMGDAHIQCTAAGKYIFKVDYSGTDPVVSVTYPAAETFTVTMEVDGPGTTDPATSVELNAFTGTEITATPTEHSGYHFKNWTGTDGITFADANNATTTAKATGMGTITAHFEKDTYIYFNNTIAQKWTKEPIYIYLYKGDGYWDSSMGTGSQEDGNYMGHFEMTKLPNTEIWSWHYDQLHSFQGGDKITYVAFSNSDMKGYQYFYNAQAVYKYYNDCMNMFVPDASQTPERLNNNTDYYNDGFWRRYNDEHSKMYLHIWDVTGRTELKGDGYEMITKTAGNDAFNRTVKLENSHQYNIYIGSCDGKNFSRETIIKSDNCSGIQLYKYDQIDDKSRLAYLNTGAGGNYVFTLTYDKDKMTLSVEYPVTTNDYRVKIGAPARYSNIIRATEPSGTISMFLNAGINTLTYEEATNVDVDPIVWGNTKSIKVNVTNAGVYTMTLTKGETPTITNVQPYTGKYYVRTDCAQGGWNEYKTNDNNLMRYTNRQPDYEDNPATGFNYYYCRWNENAEGNVRFVIANEINPCISDTLKEDAILDNTEFLKGKANIRFSWNSNTNALNRAYISGSYDDAEYLQIRSVGNKLFKKADESEPIENARLDDNNDWTYIIDVYADGQAQAAVSAKYNNKYQFFVGTGDAETGAVTETILVIEDASKAHMQLVYDFKTDRIVTGWIPGDVIRANITLQSDAILTRVHQGQLSPIKFSGDGISVLKVQTMYGVLQLDKDIMTDGHTQDADKIYERNIYWISFPFDVRVGDIFGVDGYGEKWVMQRYNGAKRAEIGWFAETSTFWEYMEEDDIMEANVGYTLTLDPDYFDNASDAMWANSKTSVSFYFPSVTHNIDVVSNGQAESSIPAHECKIDRTFDDGTKNHKNTDSHWNVIGIPTFQDLENPALAVPSVYKWDPVTNTYSIQELKNFTLEASHAYFVQWGSEDLVTWPNASIIKPSTPSTAPYAYADAKNYMVELFFSYGDKEDHTYINLKDEAKADFVLNEDMMKVTNSGQPNIYSYAGAYDVAYNATAFENQTVNLGVIARKNGSYTFAMPKDFSGKAVLVDLESGEATDLNLSNYTVELNKGTYNNRFQLLLEVEAKAPTNMNPTKGEWSEDGKTKKLFINDNIYLINGGRVYNASGTQVR